MNFTTSYRLLATILLMVMCFTVSGKKKSKQQTTTWKKTVLRMVSLKHDDVDMHHVNLRDASPDITFVEKMFSDAIAGKLAAYSNTNNDLNTRLTKEDLLDIITLPIDTMIVEDPLTGETKMKIVHSEFNYDAIRKFRILEEWVFDPATGKTEIKVSGIGPVKEVYNADGTYRYSKTLLWFRYDDIKPYLVEHAQYHPRCTLESFIWDGYFKPVKEKE